MNTKKHLFFVFALLTMILVACKPETDVKHTVTYKDSQLKTLDTHIVQSGNTDIPPATNEEKEGLDFIGWSLDENGEKLFDFNTPITSDITLYPIWEVNALYKSKSFEVRFIYTIKSLLLPELIRQEIESPFPIWVLMTKYIP